MEPAPFPTFGGGKHGGARHRRRADAGRTLLRRLWRLLPLAAATATTAGAATTTTTTTAPQRTRRRHLHTPSPPTLAALALAAAAAALLSVARAAAREAAFQAAARPGALLARPADVRVLDGDTLDVARVRIRLLHMDAPEGDQDCGSSTKKGWLPPPFVRPRHRWRCGDAATAALQRLVSASAWVECTPAGRDVYGRTLASCEAVGGGTPAWWQATAPPRHAATPLGFFFPPPPRVALAAWMVDRGWAVAFRAPRATGLAGREAAARAAGLGVWVDDRFVRPEVWRRKERQRGEVGKKEKAKKAKTGGKR